MDAFRRGAPRPLIGDMPVRQTATEFADAGIRPRFCGIEVTPATPVTKNGIAGDTGKPAGFGPNVYKLCQN